MSLRLTVLVCALYLGACRSDVESNSGLGVTSNDDFAVSFNEPPLGNLGQLLPKPKDVVGSFPSFTGGGIFLTSCDAATCSATSTAAQATSASTTSTATKQASTAASSAAATSSLKADGGGTWKKTTQGGYQYFNTDNKATNYFGSYGDSGSWTTKQVPYDKTAEKFDFAATDVNTWNYNKTTSGWTGTYSKGAATTENPARKFTYDSSRPNDDRYQYFFSGNDLRQQDAGVFAEYKDQIQDNQGLLANSFDLSQANKFRPVTSATGTTGFPNLTSILRQDTKKPAQVSGDFVSATSQLIQFFTGSL